MKLALRPYQVEALERITAAEARGIRRQLGVAATGLGKTIVFSALAEQRRERTLILAHRDELVNQAVEKIRQVWPDVDVGVVKGARNEVEHEVVVASVQTISRPNRLAQVVDAGDGFFASAPFRLIVVDECFPSGTLVGGRPIESLRAGDVVPSWDEATGSQVDRRITARMRKRPTSLVRVSLADGAEIVATPNHPVLTTVGWVPAGWLTRDYEVLSFAHHDDADRYDVHRVRGTVHDHDEGTARREGAIGSGVLHADVSGRVGEAGPLGEDGADERGARVGADAGAQPDASAGVGREDADDVEGDRPSAAAAGREWSTVAGAAADDAGRARIGMGGGARRADRAEGDRWTAVALQDRPSESGSDDRGGGGWPVPLFAGRPRTRSTQGRVAHWRRVAGVAFLEPGSDGRFSGVCPDGYVYNLEVEETHTYLVGDGVVVHNCHHSAAESYRRILDAFPEALVLGVTATPDRGDGKGLDDLFDEIVFSYDILWGIRSGFLCDVRGLRVTLHDLDLTGVKTRGGDYAEGELGRRLDDAGAPLATVMAWMEHALGRRTLVFCPTVDLAQKTAAEFAIAGVKVGFVSGETPLEERRAVLAAYSAGDIDVVVNCAVLTEGYDEPRTDCIIVARPTKSRALYTQMIGRGTRRHPDKHDLLVLDLVGASAHHSLCTIPSLFGTGQEEFDGKLGDGSGKLTEVIDEWEREQVRQGKLTAEEADLFRQMRSEIAWVPVHPAGVWPRRYERPLGKGEPRVVVTQPDAESGWWCWLTYAPGDLDGSGKGGVRILISDVDLETAQGVGEDWLRKSGKMALVASDAPWRKRAPSPKQVAAAKKFKVEVVKGMTAGEVSDAIDATIQRRKAAGKWR